MSIVVPGLGDLCAGRPVRGLGARIVVLLSIVSTMGLSFVVPGAALRVALLALAVATPTVLVPADAARCARRAPPRERAACQRRFVLAAILVAVVLC